MPAWWREDRYRRTGGRVGGAGSRRPANWPQEAAPGAEPVAQAAAHRLRHQAAIKLPAAPACRSRCGRGGPSPWRAACASPAGGKAETHRSNGCSGAACWRQAGALLAWAAARRLDSQESGGEQQVPRRTCASLSTRLSVLVVTRRRCSCAGCAGGSRSRAGAQPAARQRGRARARAAAHSLARQRSVSAVSVSSRAPRRRRWRRPARVSRAAPSWPR